MTVAVAVVAVPKNVSFSVARTTPSADWISIVVTPEDPSPNTATTSRASTVIARPRAEAATPPERVPYACGVEAAQIPLPRRPGPDFTIAV